MIVEAAYYVWKGLINTFVSNGYIQRKEDKCIYIIHEGYNIAFCGVTVDDCCFVMTQMLNGTKKYEEITIKEGDKWGLLGIQIKIDC
jgi:hypothetical protein